jgi:hypothetical protein
MAAALLLALFTPRPAIGTARTLRLRETLHLAANANTPALACAWAALSMLPLPGLAPLPFPVDRFSVPALIAASLLFDLAHANEDRRDELWPGVAVMLALVSPVASQSELMTGGGDQGAAGYLARVAALAGLVGLFDGMRYGWSHAARWLAWWGAAFALGAVPGATWGCVSLPAALVLGWIAQRLDWGRYATLLAYLLGLAALATALLLPPG